MKTICCHVIYTKMKNLSYIDGLKQGIDQINYDIAGKWAVRHLKCFQNRPCYVIKAVSRTVFLDRNSIKINISV